MKSVNRAVLSAMAMLAVGSQVYGAESASGTVNLVSVNGSGPSQTFTYSISLTNTSSGSSESNIGSFWYAWLPPDNAYDFLKSKPTAETSPTGWIANLEGSDSGSDLNSIQWVAESNPLLPGQTDTFGFTTADNFATITGPSAVGFPTGYSYVYAGAPEPIGGELGAFLDITAGASPEPTTLGLMAVAAVGLVARRRSARG